METNEPLESSTVSREDRRREEGSFLAAVVFGVPIRIHGIFSILALVFGGIAAATGKLEIALFIPAVLSVCGIHELGHAQAAKRFGYPVRSIVLHPLRGASLVPHPQQPQHDFWIAMAGPAASLGTAALTAGILFAFVMMPVGSVSDVLQGLQGNLLGRFAFFNLFLGLVNVVPVFPLDGGQALRALLATRMPRAGATRLAIRVSLLTAVIFVVVGIRSTGFYWALFALMVTMGTAQEVTNDTFYAAIKHLTASDAMQRDVRTLLLAQTLKSTLSSDLPAAQRFFPVTCGDEIFGILSRSTIEAGIRNGKGDTYLAELMNRQLVFVAPDEPLQAALERSRLSPGMPILVGAQGSFLGMITLESVQKCLSETTPLKMTEKETNTR